MKQEVRDMNGRVIKIGSTVYLYPTIRNVTREQPKEIGEVLSLQGLHGQPEVPMVWVDGKAAHHPLACAVLP